VQEEAETVYLLAVSPFRHLFVDSVLEEAPANP
jgi:hypothetical protein